MKIAYVFPGQGAQYVGMGKVLSDGHQSVRDVYRTADEVLPFSITQLCFEGPDDALKQTFHTQPALLATSVAALRAFESATEGRLQPAFVAGHSLGEYTACVAAGALSLEDGLRLVHRRGLWMDEAVPDGVGAMSAVLGMEADALETVCQEASEPGSSVELANVNCPGQIVISGAKEAVERASALAKERGAKRCIPLVVSGPFHSSLMAPAADKLSAALLETDFRTAQVPVVANVDAVPNTEPERLRSALARQLCLAVQWDLDVRTMIREGVDVFIEFGPGTVLSGLIRKIEKGVTALHVEDEASLEATLDFLRDAVL